MNTKKFKIQLVNGCLYLDKPNVCPYCGVTIDSVHKETKEITYSSSDIKRVYIVVFQCTNDTCNKYHFAVYLSKTIYGGGGSQTATLAYVYPNSPPQGLMKSINEISPSCAKIYNQAIDSEQKGLDELVGIGIRKALDFLLYDMGERYYKEESAFNNNPKTTLMDRVKKFIDNPKVVSLATASAWLGNDFTHPIRRHPDKEVAELKAIMESLVYHVDMLYSLDKAAEVIGAS